jgi:type II secretory pathway component HofQ
MRVALYVFLLAMLVTCMVVAADQNGQDVQKDQSVAQNLVTINVKDADLRGVLAMIFDQTGISYSLAEDVQGTVTAYIGDQPVDTALRSILSPRGYIWRKEGPIYIVSKKLEEQKPVQREVISPIIPNRLDENNSSKRELRTERIPLNFIDAYDLADMIRGGQSGSDSRRYGPAGMNGTK